MLWMYKKAHENREKIEMLAKEIINGKTYNWMHERWRYGNFLMQLSILWGDLYKEFYNKFIKDLSEEKKLLKEVKMTDKLKKNCKNSLTDKKFEHENLTWNYKLDYKVFKKWKILGWSCFVVVGIPYENEKWLKCWFWEIIIESDYPELYNLLKDNKIQTFSF